MQCLFNKSQMVLLLVGRRDMLTSISGQLWLKGSVVIYEWEGQWFEPSPVQPP